MNADKKTINIFIAYSQKDQAHLEALRTHAAPLLRQGRVQMWYDGEIIAGESWDDVIKAKLENADIILMLISSNSLASEYFYNEEVARAIRRHQKGAAYIVPILLSACLWKQTPLADLQGLPSGMVPISKWPDRDDAWNDVLSGVIKLIEKIEQIVKESLSSALEIEPTKQKPSVSKPQPTAAEKYAWGTMADTNSPVEYVERLKRRYEDLLEAIKRMDRSIQRDHDEFSFRSRQVESSGGLLEMHIRQAKIKVIGERIRSKEEKLSEMTATKADLESRIEFQKERNTRQKEHSEIEEAQKLAYEKIAHDIKEVIEQKAEATRKKKEEETAERRRLDPFYDLMIPIKGGTFEMGDTSGDGNDNEKPVHRVALSDYWLCKYPVTQGLWKAIMGENNNPSHFRGDNLLPVNNVSWEDTQAFLKALNQKTGGRYRLPTEAEWEYAAREGGKKVRFGNGKDIANPVEMNFRALKDYEKPYSIVGEYRKQTTLVNHFQPSKLGLYDMAGNVWEWCFDWYAPEYYGQCHVQETVSNPQGPDNGSYRVLRGGSWCHDSYFCRAACRYHHEPIDQASHIGFRVALPLQ